MTFPILSRRVFPYLVLPFLAAIALTSCPPPTPITGEPIKVVLSTGDAAPDKGLTAPADDALFRLEARIQAVRLFYTDGLAEVPVNVVAGPVVVDLLDLRTVAALLSNTTAPARAYTGVELVISRASLVLAEAPDETLDVALADDGRFRTDFAFEILPDSSGLLFLEFAGLGVFQQDDGSYLLAPELIASLGETSPDTRVVAEIATVDTTAEQLTAKAGDTTYTVDFSNAEIFVPGDLDQPGGTAADLVAGAEIAMTGTVGLGDNLAPTRIEIVDDPATPEDDAGDLITACYFSTAEPVTATTVTVTRNRLEFILAQGGFAGPCDGGEPFTLTYAAGPGGTLSGETTQEVAPGGNGLPVTAVPEEGFAFVNWSDGRTDNPRADRAVGADLTVTANFATLFSLNYAAGPGGTLSGNASQQVPEGGSGSPVTAVRNDGFAFFRWSDGRTDNPRADTEVSGDLSVTAEFLEFFTLRYTAGPGGSLEGNPLQQVLDGQNGAPVTAVPGEGFAFIGWSDGGTDNPRTDLDVSADVTVTANFAEEFSLRYAAGANGGLTGPTEQTVLAGQDGTAVTAVPDVDFGFAGWSDGRFDNPRTDTDVSADVDVVASFARAVSLRYLAGPNGTIGAGAEQVIGEGGSGAPVTAIPENGFGFDQWSDGRTDNPRVDSEVTTDIEVTASFVPAFDVVYTAGENGALEGTQVQLVNSGTNGTAVTAVPDEGFAFLEWSDGRTDNPRIETSVTADVAVTALFIEEFTLTYTAGQNGTISGSTPQTVTLGSDGEAVTAVGNEGFAFSTWSDGRTDNPRIDTEVAADVAVTATFLPAIALTYTAGENGSLSGPAVQSIAPGSDGAPVTAVPDDGYLFLMWSDGSAENPRTDLEVASALSVSAAFFAEVEMVPVPAGTFLMGNTGVGDDADVASAEEFPQHAVTLSAYEIGKFEVTNEQYMAFLAFAHHPSRDWLRLQDGRPWVGHNAGIWFHNTDEPIRMYAYNQKESGIEYVRATRGFTERFFPGLPEGTSYGFAQMAVSEVTWVGAALFVNFLSDRAGLEPAYNEADWTLIPGANGYRLPTEAEWERAAAWDGEKHWTYGFTSDELETRDRANMYFGTYLPPPDFGNTGFVNPLGLAQDGLTAYLAPVGWFNGVNISPNGNIQTVDSPSPVGAYDMSGGLLEWCHDWYSPTYYGVSPSVNPMGPDSGEERVSRSGAWGRTTGKYNQRTARRRSHEPSWTDGINGFRIARPLPE